MSTSSSVKQPHRRTEITRSRWPVRWSLAAIGIAAIAILFVGWTLVGWPVLVAAGVAVLVVRFA
jgi:hypothetical protein